MKQNPMALRNLSIVSLRNQASIAASHRRGTIGLCWLIFVTLLLNFVYCTVGLHSFIRFY